MRDQGGGGIPVRGYRPGTHLTQASVPGESILSAEIHRLGLTGRPDSATEQRQTAERVIRLAVPLLRNYAVPPGLPAAFW
jgi:hypothetical protein